MMPRSDRRVLRVRTSPSAAREYAVCVGAGLLGELGPLVREHCPAHRFAVITDSQVAARYGERVLAALDGCEAQLFTFPAGEWNKSRETWTRLHDALLSAGHGRDSAVIALGGGVVGDLAGFVAGTFLRGIPVVQVPTTLLAMLDSAVGGKTGVDTEAGKNLIGVFHPPALVVTDPETLSTLPPHQLAAGLAEAFKHGAIADAAYFEEVARSAGAYFAHDLDALTSMILRSLEIKVEVVEADEREAGYRKILNFGHTVAHALETAAGYELLHGEAVAIGMVAEARIGELVDVTCAGTADRLRVALEAARLPVEWPADLRPDPFFRALALDKKRAGGVVEYTLLAEIGRAAGAAGAAGAGTAGRSEPGVSGWSQAVSEDDVRRALFGG